MDGCPRQNPAYRPATERVPNRGPSLFRAIGGEFRARGAATALSAANIAAPPPRADGHTTPSPILMDTFQRPGAAGLYDPAYEHDNCGVGAVADLRGDASHETLARALHVLDHLEDRGGAGAEIDPSNGAGIVLQLPERL